MHEKLKEIIAQKKQEVALLKKNQKPGKFKQALSKPGLSVIAEVKRASPSKGQMAAIPSPESLALQYVKGGASAISVLTDEKFFQGSLNDLLAVKKSLAANPVPVLRKDFIIDPLQIIEAKKAGADAVLLIVAVLGDQISSLLALCHLLEIDALVEVHDAVECKKAIAMGAEIVGINNRNLNTFVVDTNNAFELKKLIPAGVITIAESGILDESLAKAYADAGFDAILVGEALVKSTDPALLIQKMRGDL